jgi:NADH-quinone oxidoreductase subunit A
MIELIPIIVLSVFVVAFGAGLLFAVSKLGPKPKYDQTKDSSYECGLEVQSTGHTKVPVRFYLTAILFILFDIEIIFMYPWAVTFKESLGTPKGFLMLSSMGFFLFIFIFGLFWEVKSKALEWE